MWTVKLLKTIRNDGVDGKHLIRFRGENSVFKVIRISVDGTLEGTFWSSILAYILTFVFSVLLSVHNTIYLEVHCPAVRPHLVVVSDSGRSVVDFTNVSLGKNKNM